MDRKKKVYVWDDEYPIDIRNRWKGTKEVVLYVTWENLLDNVYGNDFNYDVVERKDLGKFTLKPRFRAAPQFLDFNTYEEAEAAKYDWWHDMYIRGEKLSSWYEPFESIKDMTRFYYEDYGKPNGMSKSQFRAHLESIVDKTLSL